ncbi:lipocalin family protein [Chitinophaga ginsengisoli]|nr:lipocalin family protein [Chitinophaga ginsengisoli]
MKTTTMKWALMVMVSTSMFVSCKKDKDEDKPSGCEISKTNLVGSYKLTALEYKQSATAQPVNYLAFMEDCEKDDILVLGNDGNYENKDAGTVCESHEVQKGTWDVVGHTININGMLQQGIITSYDCKTLICYVENGITQGDRMTYTLVKQ